MERKLYRFAVLTSILGLLSLAVVLIAQASYPDLLFMVFSVIGLLLIFASITLYVLDWVFSIKEEVKLKNYLGAILLFLVGVVFIVVSLVK